MYCTEMIAEMLTKNFTKTWSSPTIPINRKQGRTKTNVHK